LQIRNVRIFDSLGPEKATDLVGAIRVVGHARHRI
jgi:hypothetical protein